MKVFVIHAAKLVERGKHIKRMLDGLNLPFEFVKEADADMLTEEILDKYLWCHPTIASQGSFTGAFSSSLSHKNDMLIRLRWSLKKNYKTFLYWLR